MPKRPRTLLSVLALALASQASAAVNVTNVFTPQSVSLNSPATYTLQLRNDATTQTLTGLGFDHSVTAMSNLRNFSSTCGGTLSASGSTLSLRGATIAPQSTCTVKVDVTAPSSIGNYTVTYPARLVVSDQNATNPNFSSTTLTVGNLKPLSWSVTSETSKPDGSRWLSSAVVPGDDNSQFTLNIKNPNQTVVSSVAGTLSYVAGTTGVLNLTCSAGSNAGSSVTFSNGQASFSELIFQAGETCTLRGTLRPPATVGGYSGGVNTGLRRLEQTPNGVNMQIQVTSNKQDSSINGSATVYTSTLPTLQVIKSFNDNFRTQSASSRDNTFQLGLNLINPTSAAQRVTLSDPFPSGLTPTNVTFDILNRAGSTCTTAGLSYDSATRTIQTNGFFLPERNLCTILVNFTVPANTFTGTWTNNLQNNLRTTLADGSTQTLTSPSVAYLDLLPDLTVKKFANIYASGSTNYATSTPQDTRNTADRYRWYVIYIANNGDQAAEGVTFTDPLPSGLSYNSTLSYSTCGGTLRASGQTITFSNGVIQPGGDCKVVLAVDPGKPGVYTNDTPDVSSSRGKAVASNTSVTMVSSHDAYPNGTSVKTPINTPFKLVHELNEAVQQDTTYNVSLPLPATLLPYGDQGTLLCRTDLNSNEITSQPISFNYDGTTITYSYVAGRSAVRPNSPQVDSYDSNNTSLPGTSCSISLPLVTSPQAKAGDAYDLTTRFTNLSSGMSYSATSTVSITPVAEYLINKDFNPKQLNAGGITRLSFSQTVLNDPSGSAANEYPIITDQLPESMSAALTEHAPNQPDGSYVSVQTTRSQPTLPCLEITPDRKTLTVRCIDTTVPIQIERFGDLTNTITPDNIRFSQGGTTTQSASSSVKAAAGVPISKSFSPSSVPYGQTSTLSIGVTSLTDPSTGTNTITLSDTLPQNLTATLPLSYTSTCNGLKLDYDSVSRKLSASNIQLQSDQSCRIDVQVTTPLRGNSPVTFTNTIPSNNVVATYGTNDMAASANVTFEPANTCLSLASGSPANVSSTITTPGSATLTQRLTNTGSTPLGEGDVNWTYSVPQGYRATYSFDGATGDITPSMAWSRRVQELGTLGAGQTSAINVTYQSPSNLASGEAATGSQSTSTSCGQTTLSQNLTVVKASGKVSKTQALCNQDSAGNVRSCAAPTQQALDIVPCSVIRYQVTSTNDGTAPMLRPVISDSLNSNLKLLGATASTDSGGNVLYSQNGTDWQTAPSTTWTNVMVGLDSNSDGNIDINDSLAVGGNITLTLTTQLGTCTAPPPPIQPT